MATALFYIASVIACMPRGQGVPIVNVLWVCGRRASPDQFAGCNATTLTHADPFASHHQPHKAHIKRSVQGSLNGRLCWMRDARASHPSPALGSYR